jgi:Fic family protein
MKGHFPMIYGTPKLTAVDEAVLAMIQQQRSQLRHYVSQNQARWTGFLRRQTFARAVQGSNSIEGYNAELADVMAIVDDEKPETVEEETIKALDGYQMALTYILRIHDDPFFDLNTQFVKSLHFMMLSYDMTKSPGQWRPGDIYVVHEPSGERVYEGPEAQIVPALMDELVGEIKSASNVDSIVTGAMAHLNVTMVHPFRDGNGRMARAIQTLVLARDGILSPVFSSIEEWLGRNTQAYYDILAGVGEGKWHPKNDALPWVRFCLRAHYQQAATLIRRNSEIGRTWEQISKLVASEGLPPRCELALMDAAYGLPVRNNRYRTENEISDVVASRDLKKLTDHGLLMPVGEKRGRFYIATSKLREIRAKLQTKKKIADPYDLVGEVQPVLPGL